MKNLNAYLIFDGNCRRAMEFYKTCLGGVLYMSTYGEMPSSGADSSEEHKDWIIHARLTIKTEILMASDRHPGVEVERGNNFFVCIACETIPEAEKLFQSLSEKGTVQMPLQETPWAIRFGMLTDQFGIKWMLNLEKK